ncbi:uncharacterized protein MONOS_8306 [Monocercomonoides exilis]|uniref:uncharacterized protein n=1 Tax=Monocercomonoides exilis TaxID=2049356 RepID=UPI00355A16D8|nr:hypothetical protein MONOS_8306 [Monocercomonoides exilis]|eukprot:MONOS_8306.1-p1 / transcript=MONOS_8306.1 / gene=MONOS_8306 / organism=Monocercomonoides_exilis_PA203 / gene_product=unspecified product / transcript_product=unspecified product / location=Mono_scaffold00310:35366-44148(-) / protein_length=2882 / sequence_SO=supercontig / SO=protein_coding / is_pseudo=false
MRMAYLLLTILLFLKCNSKEEGTEGSGSDIFLHARKTKLAAEEPWADGCVPYCVSSSNKIRTAIIEANTSLELRSLNLEPTFEKHICEVVDSSSLAVWSCLVVSSRTGFGISSPILSAAGGNRVMLCNVSVLPSLANGLVSSLVEACQPPFHSVSETTISVALCAFSSFVVASCPFVGCAGSSFIFLEHSLFANISSPHPFQPPQSAPMQASSTFIGCCSFSSVWDVYDGGIVSSLNNPSSSLSASNTSFVRCFRSENIAVSGSDGNPSRPERQNQTNNGANSFTWCEWNGSKTTGTSSSYSDGTSNGGAIYMYNLASGTLSVKYCSFNDCTAYYDGGGIMCYAINSIKIENNSFNDCSSRNYGGGGMYVYSIASCVRISGCEFTSCNGKNNGGGLYLASFQVSGSTCIGTESGKGESSCVFECLFTLCSLTNDSGGGMCFYNVPAAFKMSSMRFISCSAVSYGGGMNFAPSQSTLPSNYHYCYFFFFHNCSCNASTPYGHDVLFQDYYNLFSSSNPFYESYTTNSNDYRVCHRYYSSSWVYQETQKKDWLKEGMKDRYVGVGGSDTSNLCGMSEATPCKTVGHAVESSMAQLSSTVTVQGGRHVSEGAAINVGEKKISVVGRGKTVSVIGTSALSTSSPTLFSISTGKLEVGHVGIDHNSMRSPSPSVFVVSVGSGTLLLEDVAISSSTSGGSGISSSVFDVALKQLKMIDVEIKNMKMNQPLFAEPSSAGSSSGESLLGNVTIRNVNRTTGGGVVIAKSVKGGETFVVWNTTMEGCECANGNGGGIKVELEAPSSKARIGTSTSHSGGTTKFNKTKCSGYGGGVMLWLADNSFDFAITSVSFVGCSATLGGKDVFVNGSRLVSGTITTTKLNFSRNVSVYDELMGYDRNEGGMGIFPLNVFFDAFSGAAHVGNVVNGYGGYDSWFCGFGYFPCKTIAFASQNRFSSSKKNIVLDSGFELGEVVSMAGLYEWEVYCGINKTDVSVRVPSGMTSSYLINVQSASSIKNIAFQIPFSLSSATSLISLTSSSLTLTDCSVAHISESTSSVSFGYSFVNAQSGSLKMERFVIEEGLTFNDHSAIEFSEGMMSVICSGCNISGVVKNEGDGGWMKGTVGTSGTLTVDGCNVNGCSCVGGKGGGIYVGLKGNGKVVVNGSSVIDGNKAENYGGNGGRGGGMFVLMESGGCGLTIGQDVEFSKLNENVAEYGKDVFVHCGGGVLLESKVNTSSFSFFDTSTIPSDVLKLCGSENGDESGVIPLFAYLCTMGTKVIVDGSGGYGKDHNHCGFDEFRCLTVDYCANSRMSSTVNEIEIVSSSSITKEITGPSFDVIISGRIMSSDGERIGVNVSDGGSAAQDYIVGCSSSLTMRRLSFVVKGQLNSRRSAFIHSTSTLKITNCSVSFESGAMTDGKIGYSIIEMAGGNLIVDGFVMEGSVTLKVNGKSPITMTSGAQLEIMNSRVNGVEVEMVGGSGGGCLNVGMNEEGGNVNIEESNFSSRCSGGSGMKGGGMMISVGNVGNLEMKNVKLSECEVPTEDREDGGRGMGGGIFVELPEEIGSFVLEEMIFERCNAWKGKNMFVSGWDLSEVVNKGNFKWEMSEGELKSLDELCGWERKTTGEEGYVIPLVVYLWVNWSGYGFASKEKGGDFSGCGFSEAPCSSIDHLVSLRYEPLGEGESHVNIVGSGLLQKAISFLLLSSSKTSVVSIEGEKEGTGLKVSEGGRNEGKEEEGGGMITLNVCLSFTNISFSLPNELLHHSSLIHSTSSSATSLSIMRCSFICEDATKETKYCLMKADGGSVVIEDCTLSQFNLAKGFVEFTTDVKSVDVMNMTISNTTISGNSLISLSQPSTSNMLIKKAKENTEQRVRVNDSSFTNITCSESRACVMSVGSFSSGMECEIEGCVVTKCMSERSLEGGGMKMLMKRGESEVKVRGCSFGMCVCSTGNGRGGGMMIDALDPNVECSNKEIPPLGLRLENIRFMMNDAFVGKDVFIRCDSIASQINERLFLLDFSQESLKLNNSMCGSDGEGTIDVDLIPLITFYYSAQVFVSVKGSDSVQCGRQDAPCESISNGVQHIQRSVVNMILIDGEGKIGGECVIGDVRMEPVKKAKGKIHFDGKIEKTSEEDSIMKFVNESAVERCSFEFGGEFEASHKFILKVKNGSMEMRSCEFISSAVELKLGNTIVSVESGELNMWGIEFSSLHVRASLIVLCEESKVLMGETNIWDVMCEGDADVVVVVGGKAEFEMKEMRFENISLLTDGCVMVIDGAEEEIRVTNCSFAKCVNMNGKGSMMEMRESREVQLEACMFDGERGEGGEKKINGKTNEEEEMCRWEGSLVEVVKSSVMMKDTTLSNSPEGGITMSGGEMTVNDGRFENNNPSIEGYPSLRRNIICSDSGTLNVVSLKGGDGLERSTSLWMLNEGCNFEGIVSERDSSFFIPVLESVEAKEETNRMKLTFKGMLLLPCNLSFSVVKRKGEEKEIEHYDFDSNGFLSEREAEGSVARDLISGCGNEIEVSVCVLFGNKESPSSTQSFILKNASITQPKDDEIISKGENKIEWSLFAFVGCVVALLIFVALFVVVVVLMKKKLKEVERKVEKERLENEQIMGKIEKRRRENNGGSFEMSEMPSTLLEGMTSQIPLLIDNEEDLPEPPSMSKDEILNENDLPDLEPPLPFSENASVSDVQQNNSFNVISAKKPFREKEKKNIKTLHSVIHSVQGNFTLGTRAMDLVDGKEVVLAVAELFEHLISVDDERVEMMARQLCPYTIFVEEETNEIFVLAEELEDEKQKEEMKRWKAPEVGNEDEGIEQAVAFTLGLILHEMTTGEVPLSECDAEEAQEMMRDGVRPLTEGIEREELIELMEKMWADEPDCRLTLGEVIQSLTEIEESEQV